MATGANNPRRRGIRLEWATNVWNVLEVAVTVTVGIQSRSLALVAFGLDSLVEIFASSIVIWNLSDKRSDPGDRRVHRSLRLISAAFWALAIFLGVASVRGLILGSRPGHSLFGIIFMGLTAGTMFSLSLLKRRTALEVPSETLLAESALSLLDACLAASVLVALVLSDALGWWWTDALAAIVVAGFALSEGIRNWRESAPHVGFER